MSDNDIFLARRGGSTSHRPWPSMSHWLHQVSALYGTRPALHPRTVVPKGFFPIDHPDIPPVSAHISSSPLEELGLVNLQLLECRALTSRMRRVISSGNLCFRPCGQHQLNFLLIYQEINQWQDHIRSVPAKTIGCSPLEFPESDSC